MAKKFGSARARKTAGFLGAFIRRNKPRLASSPVRSMRSFKSKRF